MSLISCFIYFNPRSPHGERPANITDADLSLLFQSTLPARGATCVSPFESRSASNFNPRSPHGERRRGLRASCVPCRFQSTLPARGATHRQSEVNCYKYISTHAPRTGSDTNDGQYQYVADISTHAPRTGSDVYSASCGRFTSGFQPTLPARGATLLQARRRCPDRISTHAPRTGSDGESGQAGTGVCISTHAPRTGSDAPQRVNRPESHRISTHAPRTGSDPVSPRTPWAAQCISTHAPRTGSDAGHQNGATLRCYFNPRSPHGERHGS